MVIFRVFEFSICCTVQYCTGTVCTQSSEKIASPGCAQFSVQRPGNCALSVPQPTSCVRVFTMFSTGTWYRLMFERFQFAK